MTVQPIFRNRGRSGRAGATGNDRGDVLDRGRKRRPDERQSVRKLSVQIEFRDRRDDLVQPQDCLPTGINGPIRINRLNLSLLEFYYCGLCLWPLETVDDKERQWPPGHPINGHLVQRILDSFDVVGKIARKWSLADSF